METVLTDTSITLEELIRQVRQSARPIYVGTDGEIALVVRPVKKDLEPEQVAVVDALSNLFHKLQVYEARYQMDSEVFFYKYENALLDESPDLISWWISYSAFAETLMRYNLTRSDVECRLMAGSEGPVPSKGKDVALDCDLAEVNFVAIVSKIEGLLS